MLAPVRCFTCGALVGDKREEYVRRTGSDENPGEVLDDLGLRRYCCRRTLLSNVDVIDQVLPYYEELAKRSAEFSTEIH